MKSASPDSAQSDPALSISPEEMQNSSFVEEDQSTPQNSNTVPASVPIQGDQDSPPKCRSLEKHFSIKMDTAQWGKSFLGVPQIRETRRLYHPTGLNSLPKSYVNAFLIAQLISNDVNCILELVMLVSL